MSVLAPRLATEINWLLPDSESSAEGGGEEDASETVIDHSCNLHTWRICLDTHAAEVAHWLGSFGAQLRIRASHRASRLAAV